MQKPNLWTDSRVNRKVQIACGVAAILFGLAGVAAMIDELRLPPRPLAIQYGWLIELGVLGLAVGLVLLGVRMIRGPVYGDSKLLSPTVLYFGALIFGAPPIAIAIYCFDKAELIEVKIAAIVVMGFYLPIMFMCLQLADRRLKEGPEQAARPSQWN